MLVLRFVFTLLPLVTIVWGLGESCTSSSDCGQLECCVDEARRARRFIFGPSNGRCHARRYQGQACHVFLQHSFGSPNMFMNYCPCDENLVCRGTTVENPGGAEIHHNPICIPANEASTMQPATATATVVMTQRPTRMTTAAQPSTTTNSIVIG